MKFFYFLFMITLPQMNLAYTSYGECVDEVYDYNGYNQTEAQLTCERFLVND